MVRHPVDEENYYQYLKRRSFPGYIYRKYLLYPRLNSRLKGKILDYGCGIGDFLKQYKDVTGVDINQYNIEYCKTQGLNAELLNNGKIPFADKLFSSVVMDNVLEHIPLEEVHSVLQEISRVLKPGGILLIGVPGIKGFASDKDHKHFYTEYEVIHLLSRFGFSKNKIIHMPLYFPLLEKYVSQYCIYIYFTKK